MGSIIRILVILYMLFTCDILFCDKSPVPFQKAFLKIQEISLRTEGLNIGQISKIKIDSYGNFVSLDIKGNQVLVFDKTGGFLRRIGTRGQGPGEFISLYSLYIDPSGEIFVPDFKPRRINRFDQNGRFIDSFIQGLHWPPHILVSDSKGDLYLGGLKLDPEGKSSGSWIHKYRRSGKHLISFYPPSGSPSQDWLQNIYPFFGFDIGPDDRIYAVQMHEYKISVYDVKGRLLRSFGEIPPHFKKLDPGIKVDWDKITQQSEMVAALTRASQSWTKIIQLDILPGPFLLMTLEMNKLVKGYDRKYALDILTLDGRARLSGIPTDFIYLGSDRKGFVYFLEYTDEDTSLNRDPSYRLGKYRVMVEN